MANTDEILGMIDEVFELDLDIINDLEESNEIDLPADDDSIPDADEDTGGSGDATPESVEKGDTVEPDAEDIIDENETLDLTEYDVAVEESEPTPIIENQSNLPTIGNVQQGDRVMIALINGLPTVIGTVGSGDRQQEEINVISADVAVLGTVVADKANITDLQATNATVLNLQTTKADITELNAATARITSLETNKADITDLNATNALVLNLKTTKAAVTELQATNANVASLQTGKANVADLNAANANISALQTNKANVSDLNAAKGRITELEGDYAELSTVVSNKVDTNTLTANYITSSQIASNYAKVDAANIDTATIRNAWVDKVMVQSGLLAHQGTVYTLDAIQLNADRITAGTIDVQRLIVTVDNHKYLVLFDAQGTPSYQKLDGDVIQDLTITADKIVAGAVTTLKITTSNIVGTGGWINLRNGTFNYSNATSGLGISWDGTNLNINAGSINIGTKNVMTSISEVRDAVDNIIIGGRNLIRNSANFNKWYVQNGGANGDIWYKSASGNTSNVNLRPRTWIGTGYLADYYNKTITVSFEIMSPNWAAIEEGLFTGLNGLAIQIETATGVPYSIITSTGRYFFKRLGNTDYFKVDSDLVNGKWVRVTSVPLTVNDSFWTSSSTLIDGYDCFTFSFLLRRNGTINFRKPKIEIGNKATDWTPAPEDIDNDIATVQENLDNVLIGGRNLILGSLYPKASGSGIYRPHIFGQISNTSGRGTYSIAEHGLKFTNTSANWQYIYFGASGNSATPCMLGLEAGETYTLSADLSWKILSSDTGKANTTTYYMGASLAYSNTLSGSFTGLPHSKQFPITQEDKGTEMEGRLIYTFTVPENAKKLYLGIVSDNKTASHYAIGDYIEARNVKLLKGNKATDWTPAPEDVDAGLTDANTKADLAKTAVLNVQTLIRLYSSGVLVCKTNNTVGALVNADGSFDVTNVTWSGGTPSAGTSLATFGTTARIGTATGNNVLIGSSTIDINNGTSTLASFGSNVRIGKTGLSNLTLDYHSLILKDKNDNNYVNLSDLRDSTGYADVSDSFVGDGTTTQFTVNYSVTSVESVTIDGDVTTAYSRNGKAFTFTTAPSEGAVILIKYSTVDAVRGYTFGSRKSGSFVGADSFVSGEDCTASGVYSNAIGYLTKATGFASHAEGLSAEARGNNSHSEGSAIASGMSSHAEGGILCTASGRYSHALGSSKASGDSSHSEGDAFTKASGMYSHALGSWSEASGECSHANGVGAVAAKKGQTVIGRYNLTDTDTSTDYGKYALIIGGGTSIVARSNALTVDWDGHIVSADGFNSAMPPIKWKSASYTASNLASGYTDVTTNVKFPNLTGYARTIMVVGTNSAYTGATGAYIDSNNNVHIRCRNFNSATSSPTISFILIYLNNSYTWT